MFKEKWLNKQYKNAIYDRIEVSQDIDVNKTYTVRYMMYLLLPVFFRYRVSILTQCLQWVSWCMNDVYEP